MSIESCRVFPGISFFGENLLLSVFYTYDFALPNGPIIFKNYGNSISLIGCLIFISQLESLNQAYDICLMRYRFRTRPLTWLAKRVTRWPEFFSIFWYLPLPGKNENFPNSSYFCYSRFKLKSEKLPKH